jgi:hypothetical protein
MAFTFIVVVSHVKREMQFRAATIRRKLNCNCAHPEYVVKSAFDVLPFDTLRNFHVLAPHRGRQRYRHNESRFLRRLRDIDQHAVFNGLGAGVAKDETWGIFVRGLFVWNGRWA